MEMFVGTGRQALSGHAGCDFLVQSFGNHCLCRNIAWFKFCFGFKSTVHV